MELLQVFGSDPDTSIEGVWVPISDQEGSTGRLKIARMWNPRFKEVFRKLTDQFNNASGGADASDDEADVIMIKALAETILIDWENIEFSGKPYKYSVANCVKLLSDPRLRDFRDKVAQEASKFSHFRLKNLEATTGK